MFKRQESGGRLVGYSLEYQHAFFFSALRIFRAKICGRSFPNTTLRF